MLKNFVRADWFLGEKRLSIYIKKHLVKQIFFIVCKHESVYIQYKEWAFQKPSVHVDFVYIFTYNIFPQYN